MKYSSPKEKVRKENMDTNIKNTWKNNYLNKTQNLSTQNNL